MHKATVIQILSEVQGTQFPSLMDPPLVRLRMVKVPL